MDQSKELRELTRKIERGLQKLNSPEMCSEKITLTQCHALVEIGRIQATSLKDLARRLDLDTSTMSKTVENLVRRELATRVPAQEDRRMVTIELTKDGLDVFRRIEEAMDRRFRNIAAAIPEEELPGILAALRIYSRALEGNDETQQGLL